MVQRVSSNTRGKRRAHRGYNHVPYHRTARGTLPPTPGQRGEGAAAVPAACCWYVSARRVNFLPTAHKPPSRRPGVFGRADHAPVRAARWPYAVTPGKATRTCRGCAHGLALVLSALVDVHDEINVQHAWPVLIRDPVRYQASDMHRAVVPPAARRQPNEFPWAQRHGQQRIVQTVLFRPTDSCARSLSSSNS